MNIKEITPNVYYTGVNDRTTPLFENLWPLPYGVSYNSYIVKGSEKIALIDAVRIDEVHKFLQNVKDIADGASIDYLVVNHMEPDHSGSIPEVLRAYPNLKIVGNVQTVGMIKGFYHITDDACFITVKDGETLSLGDCQLSFHTIPMVHWPETMATYLPERSLLFSGDAFGTFGALNGAVIDTEMDVEWYFPEMYRYYSNIVGKYGKFVQNALKKLSALKIDYICSTHGPVWHEHKDRVVDIYSRLSAYCSEPGVTIIYGSMYGNTAEIAELIAEELAAQGVKNIKIHNASVSPLSYMVSDAFRYEGLIVGCPTYSMRLFPQVEMLMNALETREIKGKVFAAFGNFTWAQGVVLKGLSAYSERMNMPIVAQMAVKQSLDDITLEQARTLARTVATALTLH